MKAVGITQMRQLAPISSFQAYNIIEVMRALANEKQISVAQVTLAWLLHQPVVSSVIVGAKRVDQLEDNIASTKVALTEEELSQLNEVSKLPAEYPGWMFERQGEYRSKFGN